VTRLRELYAKHFHDARRERLFLSSVGFLTTFVVVRAVTHAVRAGVGPFGDLQVGGAHVHHLVWGILLLLGVGYLWLIQVGTGADHRAGVGAATALLYGVGSALTLDEFALWLRLEDVYWAREGRASIDAVVIFGALLSVGVWGGPFLRAVLSELAAFRR
jgi:hypothetical protein